MYLDTETTLPVHEGMSDKRRQKLEVAATIRRGIPLVKDAHILMDGFSTYYGIISKYGCVLGTYAAGAGVPPENRASYARTLSAGFRVNSLFRRIEGLYEHRRMTREAIADLLEAEALTR